MSDSASSMGVDFSDSSGRMSDMSIHEQSDTGSVPEWNFTDRLRKARESAGLDQQALAELLAKKRSTISNWERGTNRPDELALRAIAYFTDVRYAWLAHGLTRDDGGGSEQAGPGTGCYQDNVIKFPSTIAA